jgi:hypothetical protein
MKRIGLLIFLGLLQACDPYGFDFKKNPAYVLNEAFESVLSLDDEAFVEVTGKEALCLYGNQEGISYLRDNLTIDPDKVEIKPKMVENSNKHTNTPQFVGYWSYYHEKYLIDILDKKTKQELMKVLVECHYGFDGAKSDDYHQLKPKKYHKKECRLIKIIPSQFPALSISQKCEMLKVNL